MFYSTRVQSFTSLSLSHTEIQANPHVVVYLKQGDYLRQYGIFMQLRYIRHILLYKCTKFQIFSSYIYRDISKKSKQAIISNRGLFGTFLVAYETRPRVFPFVSGDWLNDRQWWLATIFEIFRQIRHYISTRLINVSWRGDKKREIATATSLTFDFISLRSESYFLSARPLAL